MHIILIPAYNPDEKFTAFAKDLLTAGFTVVSVNDGSREDCRPFFDQVRDMGIDVVSYSKNRGKGAALREGFSFILKHYPEADGVITADCDGQHTVKDIVRISRFLKRYPDRLIMGGRFSEKHSIPFRSAFGNTFTRVIFHMATGIKIRDTQTGLRGIPMKILPDLLKIKGDRYEYEMNVLLKMRDLGLKHIEIPIETIYLENNKMSHYNPFRDSWRILKQILKFCFSSMFCFALDYVLFMLFDKLFGGNSGMAYICARVISGSLNYFLNSKFIFKNIGPVTLLKYIVMALSIAGLGSGGTWLFKSLWGIPSVLCKFIVDLPLFILSYLGQREFVFKKPHGSKKA